MANAATPSASGPPPSVTTSEEWLELLDQVLLGLDHALNNRLGALRAFAELLRDDGWRSSSAATESIQREVARLAETTSIVRQLARPKQPAMTGLILEEVMADAARIQSMLYDVRDTPIDYASGPALEPVWSDRSALIRLVSLALYGLRRAARDGNGEARVAMASDEAWARITFSGAAGGAALVTDYMQALATAIGAEWRAAGGATELRLPTLKARREGSRETLD